MNTKTEIIKLSKQLLAEGKIGETIDLFLNFVKMNNVEKGIEDQIIQLAARYRYLQTNNLKGITSNSEANIERNRLVYSLLMVIDTISTKNIININNIEIEVDGNAILNDKINIQGDYIVSEEIKKNEKLVESLLDKNSKIRILFLASNPLNSISSRLDREMRDIESELIKSKNRNSFEFIKFSAVRIKDFQDSLLNYSPNFVHFSGHGDESGISLLDNHTDLTRVVGNEPLADLFKLFSNDIACVFLNSCYSKKQGELIRKFIPNVIGIYSEVPDDTAIEFSTTFYKGIGAGREIGFSFELARNSIDLHSLSKSHLPVLI